MIVRSKFPAVSIPEDVTYPELMLNKFDQYGERVAMVGCPEVTHEYWSYLSVPAYMYLPIYERALL